MSREHRHRTLVRRHRRDLRQYPRASTMGRDAARAVRPDAVRKPVGANLWPSGETLMSASVGLRWSGWRGWRAMASRSYSSGAASPASRPIRSTNPSSFARQELRDRAAQYLVHGLARPHGLIDSVSIALARESAMVGSITFRRRESAGEGVKQSSARDISTPESGLSCRSTSTLALGSESIKKIPRASI